MWTTKLGSWGSHAMHICPQWHVFSGRRDHNSKKRSWNEIKKQVEVARLGKKLKKKKTSGGRSFSTSC